MKKQNTYKEFIDHQWEFNHKYAGWSNNQMGWEKMKKNNRRIAKRREKQKLFKQLKEEDYV